LSDIAIINDILNGDKEKYSILMNRYHNEIFKYIYNMVDNVEVTNDLVQEIFFKIYKKLNQYDQEKASFRTWIYRVTGNFVINYKKSKAYRYNQNKVLYDDKINKSDTEIEKEVIVNEKITEIQRVMEMVLKPKHYQIMALHYFSNLTVKEISETTKIPLKTIYKAINSSIAKIKKEVKVDEIQ